MANTFNFSLDLQPFKDQIDKIKNIDSVLKASLESLSTQAYGEAIRLVQEKLRSNRNLYLENLSMKKQGNNNSPEYVIILREKALWIEEGLPARNLKDTHLKGKQSVVIPFTHNKNQQSLMSDKQFLIYGEIKDALRKEKISLAKPIRNSNGTAVISTVKKVTPAATLVNVPSYFKSKSTGQSILNNLQIYQHQTAGKNPKIKKTLMTFRTMSKNSKGWDVPALKGAKILDEVYQWILDNYSRIITQHIQRINLL